MALLVLENCLMQRLPQLFTRDKVKKIARDDRRLLSWLASEPEQSVNKRKDLKELEKILKKARDLCEQNMIYSPVKLASAAAEGSTPPEAESSMSQNPIYQANGRTIKSTHQRPSSSSSASGDSEGTSLTVPSIGSSPDPPAGSKLQFEQQMDEEL